MVERIVFGLSLLWWVAAFADVPVKLDVATVELGYPVNVSFEIPDETGRDIGNIDALRTGFEIASVLTTTASGAGRTVSRYNLTLYPLHAGAIAIPPLRLGGKKTRSALVHVKPSRISIVTGMTSVNPWNRESVELYVDILDDGTAVWTPPHFPDTANLFVRPLPMIQRVEGPTNLRYIRFRWAIMPLAAMQYNLTLPAVEATRFGQRLRLPLATVAFFARALPGYLPRDVPIGRVTAAASTLSERVQLRRPTEIMLTVSGAGISEEGLKRAVEERWFATSDMRFYPMTLGEITAGHGSVRTFRLTLPVEPLRAGAIQLPALIFPYWDPVAARVESAVVRIPEIAVNNPLWRDLAVAAILICLVGLSGAVAPRVSTWFTRWLVVQSAKRAARAGEQGVMEILGALAPDIDPLRSRSWQAAVARKFRGSAALSDVLARAQAQRFGCNPNQESNQGRLVRALAQLSPRWT